MSPLCAFVCQALAYYLVIVNIAGFVIMGVDKKRAVRGAWRISEASLFAAALAGGSLGCILGMQHFRHKTKRWYFKYGMPAIFLVQVLFLLGIFYAVTTTPPSLAYILPTPLVSTI